MPTYDYRCPNGHEFEVLHGMDDPGPAVCEICGAKPVTRVFRPVPIFFKGSGFYSTDYGRKKRKVEAGSGGGEGEGSKKSDDGAKKAEEKASKAAD
jgi:putative FmdB family regulatory protein